SGSFTAQSYGLVRWVAALGMVAVTPLAGAGLLVCIALALWGIANTALYPICQVRVMNSASHSQALVGTTNVSAANAGIGIGVIIGGLTIQTAAIASVVCVAAGVAGVALVIIPFVSRLAKPFPDQGKAHNA
ncbi:hypothetical protein HUW63_44440, partial [Myxococcus sp. AM001]|nr:hypothetical protein [Myxococcus sp. AM001]